MLKKTKYYTPLVTPNKPVIFHDKGCTGCNICVATCVMDVFLPNPKKGKPPIVAYPDECWYCGGCLMDCPKGDEAMEVRYPLIHAARWKDKKTGEHYRLYMQDNPLPPNKRPTVD